jgi:GH25 family lysozyme M1 (1,4-beta-N-acetylmuramidase)
LYYTLKEPIIADVYEGEYPIRYDPMYRIIFKASGKFKDGYIRKDLKVEEYVAQAKAKGQLFGLYHFYMFHDVKRQFDTLMSVVDKTGMGDMPITLDVEAGDPNAYGVSRKTYGEQVKVFLDLIEGQTHHKPIIYTGIYYWQYVDYTGWNPAEYPLWTALYPRPKTYIDSTTDPYPLPKGWYEWSMWQYTDSGRTDGFQLNDYDTATDKFKSYLDTTFGGATAGTSFEPVNISYQRGGVNTIKKFKPQGA